MFDIGWTEILILATVSLFVIGPKDIPKFFGFIGRMLAKIRNMTSEFKETVDDAIKDSELEDIKKEISFSDPELSKNISNIFNTSEANSSINDKDKKVESIKDEQAMDNNENSFAGPTEELPSGLKHIREKSDKQESKKKSNKK